MVQPEEGGGVHSIIRKFVLSGNIHRRYVLDSVFGSYSVSEGDDTALMSTLILQRVCFIFGSKY